jgi:hypothetical protein
MISYPKALDGKPAESGKSIGARFITVLREFVFAFRNPVILRGVASLSVYGGFYKSVKDYLQPIVVTMALTLPFLISLGDDKRSAVLIGIVYFILYMLTSVASRSAGSFAGRFTHIATPLNLTVMVGFAVAAFAGAAYEVNIPTVAVVGFIVLFLVENLRKPAGLAYVSDKLEKNILATALSAQSQLTSLVAAVVSPLIGLAADAFGIGAGIVLVAAILLITAPFYRVKREPVDAAG